MSRYFTEGMLTEKVRSASVVWGNGPCNVRARVPPRDAFKGTGNSTFTEFRNLLLGERLKLLWELFCRVGPVWGTEDSSTLAGP